MMTVLMLAFWVVSALVALALIGILGLLVLCGRNKRWDHEQDAFDQIRMRD